MSEDAYTDVERAYYEFDLRHQDLTKLRDDLKDILLSEDVSDDVKAEARSLLVEYEAEMGEVARNMQALEGQFVRDVMARGGRLPEHLKNKI